MGEKRGRRESGGAETDCDPAQETSKSPEKKSQSRLNPDKEKTRSFPRRKERGKRILRTTRTHLIPQ